MNFFSENRILITGGGGFLGSFVLEELAKRGAGAVFAPRSRDVDLRDPQAARRCIEDTRPDVILHLAAAVGGIGANQAHPGKFFYENAVMGLHLIEEARRFGVKKFVCLGTICAYPKFTPIPFQEDDLWNGYPEETNAPYGLAKKMLLVQIQAYRAEYGFPGVYLLPVNLYGPGDNFDPSTSHVIPAMIRKFAEARAAGLGEVVLWGDGSATREFLYVRDAAEGILAAMERFDDLRPANLGSGQEISIKDLAAKIAALAGFDGAVRWDVSKPNGQPRRKLATGRAQALFGWRSTTGLDEGLRQTIDWYSNEVARGASLREVAFEQP